MNTSHKTLEFEVHNHVGTIRLNRPGVHNAFNDVMLSELAGLFDTIEEDNSIRAVIVTGNGKSFSAGADLNWMKKMVNYSYEENLQDALMISKVFHRIYTLSKPVIAAINGAVIGGGMGFVGTSDIVIASEQAVFSLSEVKIGVVPACISPYLIKKSCEGQLKELFLSGMRFGPGRAKAAHLINYITEHDRLMDTAREKAELFLSCGPEAVGICKKLFLNILEMSLEQAYTHTAEVIARLRISDEAQEGMRAFLEKGSPKWRIK